MIRFIGAKKVSEKLAQGEKPILLDITDEKSYDRLHPKNAVHMPIHRLENEKHVRTSFPNSAREIVIFAKDYENEPAWQAAERLHELGYDNLYIYEGGKAKWMQDGLPFQAMHYPPQLAVPGHAAAPPKVPPKGKGHAA